MGAYIGNNFDYFYCTGLQKYLNENSGVNPALTVDGQIGPGTSAALKLYQAKMNLAVSGVYDASTQSAIEPAMCAKYVQLSDLRAAAATLGVSVPSVLAVTMTESKASGFNSDGSCQILFERHIFYAQLKADKNVTPQQLQQYLAQYPSIVNVTPGGYSGGVAEWARLKVAQLINQHDALMSISMGLFQIMGENYQFCGYNSVEAYYADMIKNEKLQLNAFVNFVTKYLGGRLVSAMKTQDWDTFARYYNGPAQIATYSPKLAQNYQNNIKIA